jgi:hypothetical protein
MVYNIQNHWLSVFFPSSEIIKDSDDGVKKKKKLHGLSPRANYTDRATAASRRSVANLCG